jgi:hypothetical protein
MGKIIENLFKKSLSQKKSSNLLQGDLMQNEVVKVMVSEQLGHNKEK